ncbi:hypothetical protein [Brevundimonas sp. R86498]|uniref:hypothetical protein n=1 Tax=Brevundimonas sp. R86498 TaxID=3093845 RepID=UPI0037CAC4FA
MAAGSVEDPLLTVREAFDAGHYLANNPDVADAGLDPWAHFMTSGWRERRDPNADFSVAAYLQLNPDVAEAGVNPFVHHVLHAAHEARPTAPVVVTPSLSSVSDTSDIREAFDEDFYRASNPDIADQDPFDHFVAVGWKEGRDPHPDFSVSDYHLVNPDVAAAGLNPFIHFIRHGRAEGRSLGPARTRDRPAPGAGEVDPVRAAFDDEHYRASGPVLSEAEDAFTHFMLTGWRKGRDPNSWFSVARYLQLNPDVEAAGINPFEHYMVHGRHEGRPLTHGLDFRNDILRLAPPFEAHLQSLREACPDPDPDPIDRLAQALSQRQTGRRLHITVSQDNYVGAFGGIQLCLRIEAAALREQDIDHLHLFPPATAMVVEVNRENPPVGLLLNDVFLGHFRPDEIVALANGQPRTEVSFAVHSLIGHSTPGVVGILQAFGAEAGYYWVHDYSSLCAGYALMRNDVSFCGAPPPESAACRVCQYRPRRRVQMREHERLFEAFAVTVLAPSSGALTLWRRSFPRRPAAAIAHPHARLTPRRTPRIPRDEVSGRPLRVGFLGMATHHKGWPAFAALAEFFSSDPRYEFHHLARSPAAGVPMQFTAVAPTAGDPEPMRDAVERLQLDVVVLWSLWPETFCFTAFEAVAGGAAIVTNAAAGNVAAFVREQACGLVLDGEVPLHALFQSGEIRAQARQTRMPRLQALKFSRMTADFLPETSR